MTPATGAPAEAGLTGVTETRPAASLRAVLPEVTLYQQRGRVWLNLGVRLVAGDKPIEVRAHRPSFYQPITATLGASRGDRVVLPDGLLQDFRGLTDFAHLRIRDRNGVVALDRDFSLCPGYETARVRPDAPDRSPYPEGCPEHPFTRGAVFGVEAGWSVPVINEYSATAPLPVGRYTAKMSITPAWQQALGVDRADSVSTLKVRVAPASECGEFDCFASAPRSPAAEEQAVSPSPEPRPTGRVMAPVEDRPDLRSLPANGIRLSGSGQWLRFAATVWNAGPSPLVVDGFRRSGTDVMDAYQYFYGPDGEPTGHAPAGAMEWDSRDGHSHWHFRDFARYRLLDADKQHVVRSKKEAFCLANTDAVDYTVKGANWRPGSTDLRTACGNYSSISLREVLETGSGDTYFQGLPGQSFDVSALPNGAYFIAVEANPKGVLAERSADNNVAYRKIILSGAGADRVVKVPQVGLIEE